MKLDTNTIKLFKHLLRGGYYSYLWIKYPDGKKKSIWFNKEEISSNFELPKDADIYFGVHPTRESFGEYKRAKTEDIVAVNCLIADLDKKLLGDSIDSIIERLSIQPSLIIDTGNGYHLYFLLDKPFLIKSQEDREFAECLQHKITIYTKGDPVVKDLPRILRLPGTQNNKDKAHPKPVKWVKADFNLVYSIEEIEKATQDIILPKQTNPRKSVSRGSVDVNTINNPFMFREILDYRNSDVYKLFVATRIPKLDIQHLEGGIKVELCGGEKNYQSRSEIISAIAYHLFVRGYSFDQMFKLFEKEMPGHYADLGSPIRRKLYLQEVYANQYEFIMYDKNRIVLLEDIMKLKLIRMPFASKTYNMDLAVSSSLLDQAFQFASLGHINISDRDLALRSGCSREAIRRSLKRLESYHLICIHKSLTPTSGKEGTDYDISNLIAYLGSNETISIPPSNQYLWPYWVFEIWTSYRLGRMAERIYAQLCNANGEILTIRRLKDQTDIRSDKSLREGIKDLEKEGLAKKQNNGWIKGPANLLDVAQRMRCEESFGERRDRINIERRRRFMPKREQINNPNKQSQSVRVAQICRGNDIQPHSIPQCWDGKSVNRRSQAVIAYPPDSDKPTDSMGLAA